MAGDLILSGPALVELLRAVLDRGKPFRFRARGSSMSPSVKDGDVITVSPLTGDPRLGDVVACIPEETGKLVVHRIVGRMNGHYRIAGDGDHGGQDLAHKANILGLVTRIERGGKDVHFGLGRERRLIAITTRNRLIRKTTSLLWRLLHPLHARLRGFA